MKHINYKKDDGKFPLNSVISRLSRIMFLPFLELKSIPEFLFTNEKLKELKYLVLSSNEIEQLPEKIGTWEKLETLILTSNPLKQLPESVGN